MGEELWTALSAIVSRSLAASRGVIVPKFGTFTLTTESVDLEGVTNERRKNDQQPVFLVSHDFAQNVRSGIQHATGVRPYAAKGFSGKTAAAPINIVELAQHMQTSKEAAKRLLETEVRALSDQAATGSNVRKNLPGLGTFVVKSGIAAVVFSKSEAAGQLEIDQGAATWLQQNLDIDVTKIRPSSANRTAGRPRTANVPLSKSARVLRVGDQAKSVVTDNHAKISLILNSKDIHKSGLIGVNEAIEAILSLQLPNLDSESVLRIIRQSGTREDSALNLSSFLDYIRPAPGEAKQFSIRSNVSRTSSMRSDLTINYGKQATLDFASEIYDKKMRAIEQAQKNGMRPRVKQAPSQILSILKRAGVQGNIHLLHAYMRDACISGDFSLLDLINSTKEVLQKDTSNMSVYSDISIESSRAGSQPPNDATVTRISELLSKHDLTQLFEDYKNPYGIISQSSFVKMISDLSHGAVPSSQAILAYAHATRGSANLNEVDFIKIFEQPEHIRGMIVQHLTSIRKWLRDQKLTSEQGFARFCSSARSRDQFDLPGFIRALRENGFTIQENHAAILFQALDTKKDSIIDISEWLNKVYEDGGAYQSIKDIMDQNSLNVDDLVQRFGDRDRLTIQEMSSHLQQLDSTLTAIKAVDIASAFARGRGYIDIADFRSKVENSGDVKMSGEWLKQMYRKIESGHVDYQALKKLFTEKDRAGSGELDTAVF